MAQPRRPPATNEKKTICYTRRGTSTSDGLSCRGYIRPIPRCRMGPTRSWPGGGISCELGKSVKLAVFFYGHCIEGMCWC
jgi:hypothetical protein